MRVFRTPSLSTQSGNENSDTASEVTPVEQHKTIQSTSKVHLPKKSEDVSSRKKARKISSAAMIAKAKTSDGSIPLPESSIECNPKPFFHDFSGDIPGKTLALYERYRGYRSREYAIRCLTIANSFKDKPWLQQVRQAVMIARKGVDKTVLNKPNIFATERAQYAQQRLEQKQLSGNTLAREHGQLADRPTSVAEESIMSLASILNEGHIEDTPQLIHSM